jgi:hypothetical protein
LMKVPPPKNRTSFGHTHRGTIRSCSPLTGGWRKACWVY